MPQRKTRKERAEALQLDVDLRMLDLWRDASAVEEWDLKTASQFMRSAYAHGYQDALEEPSPGELHRAHGYRPPRRRAT